MPDDETTDLRRLHENRVHDQREEAEIDMADVCDAGLAILVTDGRKDAVLLVTRVEGVMDLELHGFLDEAEVGVAFSMTLTETPLRD